MTNTLFKTLESAALGQQTATIDLLKALKFDLQGLIPVIAQQHDTGEVLMLAWMNREALEETLHTKRVCYWSRSRQRLWRKGESSGQVQSLISAHLDCDGDTLLLKVEQQGPACHTGRRSCFYHQLDEQQATISSEPLVDPKELYS